MKLTKDETIKLIKRRLVDLSDFVTLELNQIYNMAEGLKTKKKVKK